MSDDRQAEYDAARQRAFDDARDRDDCECSHGQRDAEGRCLDCGTPLIDDCEDTEGDDE